MRLKNKAVIVTGAGQGLGKGIALRLAAEGAKVTVVDIDQAKCLAVKEELVQAGYQAIAVPCNVANRAEVENMVEETVKAFGTVDVLINNAGITRDSMTVKMSDAQWDAVLDVNLKSVFLCCQAVLKVMVPQMSGKIVNIASLSGEMGNIGQLNYSAAKAGVIGVTKTLAREMAKKQINVNAISPGFIDSEMTAQIPEQVREQLIKAIPLGRSGKPLDIANACLFLASDESDYITGQVLRLNGGVYM